MSCIRARKEDCKCVVISRSVVSCAYLPVLTLFCVSAEAAENEFKLASRFQVMHTHICYRWVPGLGHSEALQQI